MFYFIITYKECCFILLKLIELDINNAVLIWDERIVTQLVNNELVPSCT